MEELENVYKALRECRDQEYLQDVVKNLVENAWDDGWICRPVMGMNENPYRTGEK